MTQAHVCPSPVMCFVCGCYVCGRKNSKLFDAHDDDGWVMVCLDHFNTVTKETRWDDDDHWHKDYDDRWNELAPEPPPITSIREAARKKHGLT